jgi:hypothetical protein
MRGAPDIADAPAIPGLLDRQGRARHHCGLYRLTVSPPKTTVKTSGKPKELERSQVQCNALCPISADPSHFFGQGERLKFAAPGISRYRSARVPVDREGATCDCEFSNRQMETPLKNRGPSTSEFLERRDLPEPASWPAAAASAHTSVSALPPSFHRSIFYQQNMFISGTWCRRSPTEALDEFHFRLVLNPHPISRCKFAGRRLIKKPRTE